MNRKRILVVDDSETSRNLLARLLADVGWTVLTARDGAEGAVLALQERPDVVVTDLEMPVMDGFQLARLLKSDRTAARIPVLILTSHADASSRFWGRETGADAYLLKSEVHRKLVAAVDALELGGSDPAAGGEDEGAPRTPLEVLARVGRHLDARLLEAVLVNRLLEGGMEAEDLASASRSVLETLSELADCWSLGLMIEEAGDVVWFVRSDADPEHPALASAFVELCPVDTTTVETTVWASGQGVPEGAGGEISKVSFPMRGGRGALFLQPKTGLRSDLRELRLLEATRRHLALVLDNARLAQRLKEQSMIDGLTHLFNRRTIRHRLDQELERARRHGQPLSLVLCDLDRFKSINDTHGHLAGDLVLKMVADLFRHHARAVDILGRFGGEEFVFVLPDASLEAAVHAANRLMTALAADRVPTGHGATIPVTASFGVASVAELEDPSPDALLALADQRLYEAKNRGRNRVVP